MVEKLLEEWWNGVGEPDLPLPLDAQAKLISKKYDTTEATLPIMRYNPETESEEEVQEECILIRFKDVVCKYRPHLHLGDFWLHLRVINNNPNFKFYYRVELDDEVHFHIADHPHLSGGIPCLGSHQGDINTAFSECNFIRFMSQMKQYLSSYYGRSTYTRGSEYKKTKIYYKLHGYKEIVDMFAAETDENESFDINGVATDPMRWNWPKELTAWGHFELQGQELRYFLQYLRSSSYRLDSIKERQFPYLDEINPYRSQFTDGPSYNRRDELIAKILGYVAICHHIGEMPLFKAIEFTRIFILKLYLEYMGEIDEEVMASLRKMSSTLNDSTYRNKWNINTRYSVVLDNERRTQVDDLHKEIREIVGTSGESFKFMTDLKFAGHKLSNFMILIRKNKPEAATCEGYLHGGVKQEINLIDLKQRYNKIEKFVYKKALDQLEKDRRKFINELNRPDIVHIQTDDGQGTLFSQEL